MGSKWGTIINEAKYQGIHNARGRYCVYSVKWIKANARIRVEKVVDLILKSLGLKILGQPRDELLLTTMLKMLRLHAGSAIDSPETPELPPMTEVVWQQLQGTHLFIIQKNSTTATKNVANERNLTLSIQYGFAPGKPNWEHSTRVPQSLQEMTVWNPTKRDWRDSQWQWRWLQFPPKRKASQTERDSWGMKHRMKCTCNCQPQFF